MTNDADIRDMRNDIRKLDERIYDQQVKTQEKLADLQASVTRVESILSTSLRHLEASAEAHNKEIAEIKVEIGKQSHDLEVVKNKADQACIQVIGLVKEVDDKLEKHSGDGFRHYRNPEEDTWFSYAKRRPYISIPATGGAVGTAGFIIYIFVEYILPLLIK